MENITSNLETISGKIEKLIHLHNSLKEQNQSLLIEKQELLKKINFQDKEINQLNENFKVLKITKVLAGTAPDEINADAKSKINELVREIDKCIALLNK